MEEKIISLADLSCYLLVSKEDWEKIKKHIRELSEERNMWKEKHDLQRSENVRLAYIIEKTDVIAKVKCPEIVAFLERMKLMREQSIKDMTERAKGGDEEHAHKMGEAIRRATPSDNAEKENAEEETKSSDKVILTEEEVNKRLRGRHAVIHTSGIVPHIPVDFERVLHQDGKWCLCWRSGIAGRPHTYIFDEDDVVSMMEQGGTFVGKLSYAPTCEDDFSVNAPDEEEAKSENESITH